MPSASEKARAPRRARTWQLYAAGALGPYGSTMVTPIVPEAAHGLGTAPESASGAVTAYMLPFAALMLVSGTLAERWGRGTVLRASLAVSVLACVLCALAPDLGTFLAARALHGATNAFTTPLLVAALADAARPGRLGRALGWFAAAQAAGQGFSPLVSGTAAMLDWRLAFVLPAAGALLVVVLPAHPSVTARRATGRAAWGSLLSARLAAACALAFLCYLAAVGLTVLAVLRAEDAFALGPVERGLVAASFGIAGLLLAGACGRALDRLGPYRIGALANVLLALGLVLAAAGPAVALLVAGITATGVAVTALRASVGALAATSAPANRAGAASLALAAQFSGGALAPVLWVPLYGAAPVAGFAATALAPVAALALLGALAARTPRSAEGAGGAAPHPAHDPAVAAGATARSGTQEISGPRRR